MHKKNGLDHLIRNSVYIVLLSLVDLIALYLLLKTALFVRVDVLPMLYPGFPPDPPFGRLGRVWWIFPVWIFFFSYEGLYSKRLSFWDEINALWKVAFFSTVGVFAIVSLGKLSSVVSRTVVILMGMLALFMVPVIRLSMKRFLLRYPWFRRRVLILGAGETGKLFVRALMKEPNYGYDIMGFLDDDPEKAGKKIMDLKVHRGVDRAASYLRKCYITDVIIAMPGAGKERLQHLINSLQHKADRILFVPDMYGIAVLGTSLQHFFHEQAFALELKNNLARPVNIILKRCFDLIMSFLLLPFVLLSILMIGVLIKLDSSGPVIFTQERLTRHGRRFSCYKFRTMYQDADQRLAAHLRQNPGAREEMKKFWKLKDDPRVTRIGKFLRSTSLDELPQIWNVLRGEMSLVGPRPYLPEEQPEMGAESGTILKGIPGITGLWQVSGRSNTNYTYRLSLDSWYVRNWNIWLDIVILLKTVGVVLKREGAW